SFSARLRMSLLVNRSPLVSERACNPANQVIRRRDQLAGILPGRMQRPPRELAPSDDAGRTHILPGTRRISGTERGSAFLHDRPQLDELCHRWVDAIRARPRRLGGRSRESPEPIEPSHLTLRSPSNPQGSLTATNPQPILRAVLAARDG